MRTKQAFCLVELMVVLLLFAGMVIMSISYTTYQRGFQTRLAVEKLAILARSLQSAAIAQQRTISLIFDQKKNLYTYDGIQELLPRGVTFGYIAGTKGPPARPNTFIQNSISFIRNTMLFHADGIIQPGTVYLVSDNRRIMYALSSAVAPFSYIRVYKYRETWQSLSDYS